MWGFLLNPTVLLGIALAGASAFGWLQTHRLGNAQDKVAAVTAAFEGFKAQTAALGEIAKKQAAAQTAADLQRQEKSNAENRRTRAADLATIAKLRNASSSRSIVPATPTCPELPSAACLDRAKLESALRVLVGEVRGLVDEGSAAVVDLNSAKLWAGKMSETLTLP